MGTARDLAQLVGLFWSLLLGNVVEWYEYAVYGYLAPYLEEHFFQGSQIATWLGFAVTFLARPLGGAVFGALGDALGRNTAVNLSIVGMLVGTCGQGLLPTYASGATLGHVGVTGLVILRFVQGLSAAGEIATIATYITEMGSKRILGRSIALISMTASAGFLSAKAAVFLTTNTLGLEAVSTWAWRLPFVFALLPGLLAVWGRRRVPESAMFVEAQQAKAGASASQASSRVRPSRSSASVVSAMSSAGGGVSQVLASHGASVLLGGCAMAAFAVLQYGGFVWIQSYLAHQQMAPRGRFLVGLCARLLMMALALPMGWLADVKGVGCVMLFGSIGIALFSLPLFALVAAAPADLGVVLPAVGVGLASLLSTVGTVSFLFIVELFPTSIRNTAVGISYNCGFSLFGGLAPVLNQASLKLSPLGPGFILSAGGLISTAAVATGLVLQRKGKVKLAHVREVPYFGCADAAPEQNSEEERSEESGESGEESA